MLLAIQVGVKFGDNLRAHCGALMAGQKPAQAVVSCLWPLCVSEKQIH